MTVLSCEGCRGEGTLRKKMEVKLTTAGIDPAVFITSDPPGRFNVLVDGFHLADNQRGEQVDIEYKVDTGMIVIKPEMMRVRQKVYSFLEKTLGVVILGRECFIYAPEDYWQVQGGALRQYLDEIPHAALVFLLSITEPSEIIFFRHLKPGEYKNKFRYLNPGQRLNGDLESSEDPQRVFTELFVRYPGSVSLRHEVCLEEMSGNGFLTMEGGKCPGICWDFTSFFRNRSKEQNFRTFNGIHSPRNRDELRINLSVLGNLYHE